MADDNQNQEPKAEPITLQQVAELVNQAITSHNKRNEAKQMDAFKALIGDALKAYQPPPPPPSDDDGDKKKGKVDPQVAALQAKIEEYDRNLKAAADRASKAEEKAKQDNAYNTLRSTLAPHVRPDVVDSVTRLLFHGENRVEYDEQGQPLFRVRKPMYQNGPEEETLLPIADGVDFYLKSKEAAAFLPAPAPAQTVAPARGSRFPQTTAPNQIPKYDKPASTDDEKVRRAMELERALAQKLQ